MHSEIFWFSFIVPLKFSNRFFGISGKADGGKSFSSSFVLPERKSSVSCVFGFKVIKTFETASSATWTAICELWLTAITFPHFSTLLRGKSTLEPRWTWARGRISKTALSLYSLIFSIYSTSPGMLYHARSAEVLTQGISKSS